MTDDFKLKQLASFSGRKGPVVLAVLDGVGIGKANEGNAVHLAYTPTLDKLRQSALYCELKAHGTAVGLPSDSDMGNSEVGHNAIGSGQIYDQGAKLVAEAILSGNIFSDTWKELLENCHNNNTSLHFLGLLSDGNVHSHINHLISMLKKAHDEGVKQAFVHTLLDGRDVSETSALKYIDILEECLREINQGENRNYKIASGGGRMHITMDRYQADWNMVKRGWSVHVLGKGRSFTSATEAIQTFRSEKKGLSDQFLPEFVIHGSDGKPVGQVCDNDSVIFFNFRGDRAMEITQAFTEENFSKFDRERFPKTKYAGMMQYDGDQQIPKKFLVQPPSIDYTLGEYLAKNNIAQFATSETQKYGHVTYFWNGNRLGKFSEDLEVYQEIPSDQTPFEERPWMKAAEITDAVIGHLEQNPQTKFVRLNYPNGDMIGHTGDLQAAILSVSAVDLSLRRLLEYIDTVDGVAIILADHGNADEMYEVDSKGNFIWNAETQKYKNKTSHSLNPVPFAIYDPLYDGEYAINNELAQKGLANVAATIVNLMGYEVPSKWHSSLIVFK